VVDEAHTDRVVDEAAEDALTEHVRRPHAVGELVLGPARVAILDVLGPLEEVRNPPDVPFGQRELELREPPPEVRHMRSPRE